MADISNAIWYAALIPVAAIIIGCFLGMRRSKRRHDMPPASLRDYGIVGAIILSVGGVGMIANSSQDTATQEMLRAQFALDPDVEMIEFDLSHSSRGIGALGRTSAIYQFTEAQMRRYKSKLGDHELWFSQPFEHFGRLENPSYTSAARRWRRFPRPLRAADIKGKTIYDLPWLFSLWSGPSKTVKNGRLMCFIFQETTGGTSRASACSDVRRSERAALTLMAILDYDRKTLSVSMY